MTINRSELKQKAKYSLKGKWGVIIPVLLVYLLILLGAVLLNLIPIVGVFISLFITSAISAGVYSVFLKTAKNEDAKIKDLFGFMKYCIKATGLTLVIKIFICLWSLLLIIPGIIAAFRYSMAFYLFVENPDIGIMEAIKQSKIMTKGYKWNIFVLYLSFFGWNLLAPFTLGILYFWLIPYMRVTYCNLYLQLKHEEPQTITFV